MAKEVQAWSPFRELDRFRREFDSMFDRFLGGPNPLARVSEAPPLESFIDDGQLVVHADLPGLDPKNIEITVNADVLMIRGHRQSSEERKERDFIHREISYGDFERSMKLPAGIDSSQIKASYNNGVLELRAPLPKEMTTRTVPIQVESSKEKAKPQS